MARSENNTGDILSHDEHDTSISQNQKKAKEYFESLPKKEQKILINKFEDEKITSDILKTLYKKEGLDSPLFRVMFYGFVI
jgi:DNA-directed RNA polymerase specialized sigma subunit